MMSRQPRIKVILDTDIGTDVDDAIALAFALNRPELEVCAITTTRHMPDQRAAIVARLLQVVDRTDIPFAAGSNVLFNGSPTNDKPVNQYPFAAQASRVPAPACESAQFLLRRTIDANWGDVWLATIGPMTNAAILLRDQPEITKGLNGIVCMASEPTRPHRETNILRDPHAAAAVFSSGLLKFVGTYDVTRRVAMTAEHLTQLRMADKPLTQAMMQLIALWRHATRRELPVVFDMCPLTWLFAPQLFTVADMPVAVDLSSPKRAGMMCHAVADTAPIPVSTDAEHETLLKMLIDTLITETN